MYLLSKVTPWGVSSKSADSNTCAALSIAAKKILAYQCHKVGDGIHLSNLSTRGAMSS